MIGGRPGRRNGRGGVELAIPVKRANRAGCRESVVLVVGRWLIGIGEESLDFQLVNFDGGEGLATRPSSAGDLVREAKANAWPRSSSRPLSAKAMQDVRAVA